MKKLNKTEELEQEYESKLYKIWDRVATFFISLGFKLFGLLVIGVVSFSIVTLWNTLCWGIGL